MVGVNLADFKPVATSTLNTGFYQEAAKKSARIILLRTPKNIKAANLDGVKLEMPQEDKKHRAGGVKATFMAADENGQEQQYQIAHSMAGSLAPVALALPHKDCVRLEKAFDQVLNVSMLLQLPQKATEEVDLEADYGGRSWKKIPQAENLRMPLSATDISLSSSMAPSKAESPEKPKNSKKRKSAD